MGVDQYVYLAETWGSDDPRGREAARRLMETFSYSDPVNRPSIIRDYYRMARADGFLRPMLMDLWVQTVDQFSGEERRMALQSTSSYDDSPLGILAKTMLDAEFPPEPKPEPVAPPPPEP